MLTIYIDILFFLNFILNITILNAESILLKIRTKPARLIAGAALGAVYSCLVFILDFKALSHEMSKIIFAALMTSVSFGAKRMRVLARQTIALFLITICMGMFIMSLLYFTSIGIHFGGMVKKGVFYFDIPLSFILPMCPAATFIAIQIQKALQKPAVRHCVTVTITYKGKTVTLTALTDTGNGLTDPISGKKVLVVEAKSLKKLLEDFDLDKVSECNHEKVPTGFRLIPFSSIGEKSGLLPAFLPDRITVNGEGTSGLIVAFFDGVLSQNGDYDALIGPYETKRKDVTYA